MYRTFFLVSKIILLSLGVLIFIPQISFASSKITPSTSVHDRFNSSTDVCSLCHIYPMTDGSLQLNYEASISMSALCMVCHDGTITETYNVSSGIFIASDSGQPIKNNGGLFPGTLSYSGSEHSVFGDILVGQANGGNRSSALKNSGTSNTLFDCVSCHLVHREGYDGNARLLNPNPNWIQTQGQDPSSHAGKTQVLIAVSNEGLIYNWPPDNFDKPLLNYPYNRSTKVYVEGQLSVDGRITFEQDQVKVVFSFPPPVGSIISADYTPALQIKMNIIDKMTSNETVDYLSGINGFCGSCHTDYDTSQSKHLVGISWPSRKTTESRGLKFEGEDPENGIINCLTCHLAHGVNSESTWKAVSIKTGISEFYSAEYAGGSKLKRLPNMAICETCHEKGLASYSTYWRYTN